MSTYTRSTIKSAFITLLDERPISRITVKDIVSECGINRNTFYYYFQDLPALAEAVVEEDLFQLLDGRKTPATVEECLDILITAVLAHRSAALHLYRSANRERFELSLWRVCESVSKDYLSKIISGRQITEKDRQLLQDYLRSILFGWTMDWLERGLDPKIREQASRICALRQGEVERMLAQCEASALDGPLT